MTTQNNSTPPTAPQVQAIIEEYRSLRTEVLHYINIQIQIPIWALGATSIAVPILVTQVNAISPELLVGILYLVTIIFSAMAMNYSTSVWSMHEISSYIRTHTHSLLNSEDLTLMYWESYVTERRRSPATFFIESIGGLGVAITLFLPGIISVIAANYLLNSITQPNVILQGVDILLSLKILQLISISCYVISVFSIIATSANSLYVGFKYHSVLGYKQERKLTVNVPLPANENSEATPTVQELEEQNESKKI